MRNQTSLCRSLTTSRSTPSLYYSEKRGGRNVAVTGPVHLLPLPEQIHLPGILDAYDSIEESRIDFVPVGG